MTGPSAQSRPEEAAAYAIMPALERCARSPDALYLLARRMELSLPSVTLAGPPDYLREAAGQGSAPARQRLELLRRLDSRQGRRMLANKRVLLCEPRASGSKFAPVYDRTLHTLVSRYDARELRRQTLDRLGGLQLCTGPTGPDAPLAAADYRPDLVILCNDSFGFSTARLLREQYPKARQVLSCQRFDYADGAPPAGFDGILCDAQCDWDLLAVLSGVFLS